MSTVDTTRDTGIYVVIVSLSAATLALDASTRIGFAEWVIHLIPIALCVFHSGTWAPFAVTRPATLLMEVSLQIWPGGTLPRRAP